jgi:4,5-dihydroxyphthalate decarboxylase
VAAASEWYRKHRIFPIMHLLGIRKDVVEQHRYLPGALFKAFEEAKSVALARLSNTAATKVTLPFVE